MLFVVGCCLQLFNVGRALIVVCCFLCVVVCLLFVLVVCCSLFAVRCSRWFDVCCVLFVVCYVLFVGWLSLVFVVVLVAVVCLSLCVVG